MADLSQQSTGSSATATGSGQAAVVGSDGVIVDKNKSQEQYIKDAEAKYIVPALVREKFPDLVKLIYETESMNQEEREYWLQIMPIMSEEQIVKFRDILVNEKSQLQRLDQDYEKEMSRIAASKKEINEDELKQKMQQIKTSEQASEKQEQNKEEELLKNLGSL
mgnify:CR=1 FL=1